MAKFSSNIYIMQEAMDKISVKLFRDFIELENLQGSQKTAERFAQMSYQRVKEQLSELLVKGRVEYDISFADEKNTENKSAEFTWIVNPICGWYNLQRSIPYFATTIALEKINIEGKKEVIAGWVENIITKEAFCVESGKGAFFNGRRIRVVPTTKMSEASLVLNSCKKHLNAKSIAINNCVALDLAYMASGKYDGVIIFNPKQHDIATGLLLVKEAGGFVEQREDMIITATNDVLLKEIGANF